MIEQIQAARSEALQRVDVSTDLDEVRRLESELLGKKGPLSSLKAQLGSVADIEARKAAGAALGEAIAAVSEAVAARRHALERADRLEQLQHERLDLTEVGARAVRGHAHIVTQAWERLEDVFAGLGFQIAEGPEVETRLVQLRGPQHSA